MFLTILPMVIDLNISKTGRNDCYPLIGGKANSTSNNTSRPGNTSTEYNNYSESWDHSMKEVSEQRYSPYSANTFTDNNYSWNRDVAVPSSHEAGSNLHSLVPSTVTVRGQDRYQIRTDFINSQNDPVGGFSSIEMRTSGRYLIFCPYNLF